MVRDKYYNVGSQASHIMGHFYNNDPGVDSFHLP